MSLNVAGWNDGGGVGIAGEGVVKAHSLVWKNTAVELPGGAGGWGGPPASQYRYY